MPLLVTPFHVMLSPLKVTVISNILPLILFAIILLPLIVYEPDVPKSEDVEVYVPSFLMVISLPTISPVYELPFCQVSVLCVHFQVPIASDCRSATPLSVFFLKTYLNATPLLAVPSHVITFPFIVAFILNVPLLLLAIITSSLIENVDRPPTSNVGTLSAYPCAYSTR